MTRILDADAGEGNMRHLFASDERLSRGVRRSRPRRQARRSLAAVYGWLLAALLLAPGALHVAAQTPTEDAHAFESYPLRAEHWAVRAAERAAALRLAPEYLPAQREAPMWMVGVALRDAALRAPVERPALAETARGWYRRFTEEFPGFEAQLNEVVARATVSRSDVRAGFEANAGRVAPGFGIVDGGATVRRAPTGVWTSLPVGAHAWRVGAAAIEPVLRVGTDVGGDEGRGAAVSLGEWSASLGAGPLSVRLGHGRTTYGFGEGAVVLGGAEAFDRLELESRAPFRLPGLGFLGDVAFHTALSRLDTPRHATRPWLLATSATFRPHGRFDVQLNRGFIFGGDGTRITAGRIARMLVGQQAGTFEDLTFANQVGSLGMRWRIPAEELLPLTAYYEWGMDDASGAWAQLPGTVIGVLVPALPGAPEVALGVEHTSFAAACCGHPSWYRHGAFAGGWVVRDHPAGHSLGGSGEEMSLLGRADLASGRLALDGRVFLRTRADDNLFAPGRAGESRGFRLQASHRLNRRTELSVELFHDAGSGWSERALIAGASAHF